MVFCEQKERKKEGKERGREAEREGEKDYCIEITPTSPCPEVT